MKFPTYIDKNMIYGRHLEIHTAIKFLTGFQGNDQRILHINGIHGVGQDAIARFSVKYVMNRHFFPDCAYYIDATTKFSANGLLLAISKKMQLITNDR